jgi:hypothetical protein
VDDLSGLERLLARRHIEQTIPPPQYVLFIDILGFSDLTEEFPNPVVWNFGPDDTVISAATSESSQTLGRFQYVLDSLSRYVGDASGPTNLMLFSDCAFLVFENLLQAATCAAELMRRFLQQHVPVRMGLAHGTWNAERFSFDSVNKVMITRSVFSGTGVVRAHKAECNGGKGFRIFVHSSVEASALAEIATTIPSLQTLEAHPIAAFEAGGAMSRDLQRSDERDLLPRAFPISSSSHGILTDYVRCSGTHHPSEVRKFANPSLCVSKFVGSPRTERIL